MNHVFFAVFAFIMIFGITDSFADRHVEIQRGQTIQIGNLELSFTDVEDSRCLSDTTCIWEGQVTATIHIQNKTHSITGNLTPGDSLTDMVPHIITLVDVNPHPASVKISNYTATVIL